MTKLTPRRSRGVRLFLGMILGAGLVLGSTAVVAAATSRPALPDASLVGTVMKDGNDQPIAMCRPGELYESYAEPMPDDEVDASHDTPEAVADAFIAELQVSVSADNPGLRDLPADVRESYLEYFEKYFAPTRALTVPNRSDEGDKIVFSRPMPKQDLEAAKVSAEVWSSVRVEIVKSPNGNFRFGGAVLCTSALFEDGAIQNHPVLSVEKEEIR